MDHQERMKFLDWVTDAYDKETQRICAAHLERIPEEETLDPNDLYEIAWHAHTRVRQEEFDKIGNAITNSNLSLE